LGVFGVFVCLRLEAPQLDIRWLRASQSRSQGFDATAKLKVDGKSICFAVEIQTRSTPRVFAEALSPRTVNRLRALTASTGKSAAYLLLVMPYLAPARLAELCTMREAEDLA